MSTADIISSRASASSLSESSVQENNLLDGKPLVAYLASVAAATLCFAFLTAMFIEFYRGNTGAPDGFLAKAEDGVFMTGFMFVPGFIFCLITTFIPYFAAFKLAIKFKIESPWYFKMGGILTAAFTAPIFPFIKLGFNESVDDWINEPTYLQATFIILPFCCVSGFIASIAAIWTLRRTGSTGHLDHVGSLGRLMPIKANKCI